MDATISNSNFTFVEPATSETPPKKRKYLTEEAWKPYQDLILELVHDRKLKLPDVAAYMAENHGFHASPQQYARALEAWGKRPRNIWLSPAQIAKILNDVEARRNVGKESAFRYTEKRGGEKVSFQSMLKYLRRRVPQMQAASFEERQKIASKVSIGLSSEGVVVYTPTDRSIASTQNLRPASSSASLIEIASNVSPRRASVASSGFIEADPASGLPPSYEQSERMSSSFPSTLSVASQPQYGNVFPITRADLQRGQLMENAATPYGEHSLPTAIVMDISQMPPAIQLCHLPMSLNSSGDFKEPYSRVSSSVMISSNLFASFIDIHQPPNRITLTANKIYSSVMDIRAELSALDQTLAESSVDHVEDALARAVSRSVYTLSAFDNTLSQTELLRNFLKNLSYATPYSMEQQLWTDILRQLCPGYKSTGDLSAKLMNPMNLSMSMDYDPPALTVAAWMNFFRQDWESCIRISEMIHHQYMYYNMSHDERRYLRILNKLRMSFCFEALGAYKQVMEELEGAAEYAKQLKPEDQQAVLAFVMLQKRLLRINISFKLYGFQPELGSYPTLNEVRKSYSVPGTKNIVSRAIIYRLEMLELDWDALPALHRAMQEYSSWTPDFTDNASYDNHRLFCPHARNAIFTLLSRSPSARPTTDLYSVFKTAISTRENLDLFMLNVVQSLGINLSDELPLFSQARHILKEWFHTFDAIWGMREVMSDEPDHWSTNTKLKIDCVWKIRTIMNIHPIKQTEIP